MDLHKLQTRIKELGSNTGGKGFVYGLLLAYNIPRATLDRYESQMKKTSELGESLEIGRKVFVVITERDNLLSIFDNLKEKGLHKIKTRFILIANEQDLVIHDLLTEDTLKSTIPDFCKSFEFLIPLLGIRRIDSISNRSVDLKAAEKFAKLYNQLLLTNDYRDDSKRARLNVVMARILFCFFSDGVGLIEKGSVFRILSTYTDKSGMDLNMVLGEMFESLSTPEKRDIKEYLKAMPFIDSTLFCGDIDLPTFNKETRKLLLECAELDWSDINPDILGSLIQSIVFPESFHGLSNHFTSIPNIHKVIDPLFLNELYEDFEKNKDNYDDLMNLLKRIGRIKILDPSCGSGNFLIVLYKELKILENKIINIIRNITNGEKEPIVRVSMMQFYGIERNEFACEIAKLGLFFTECQLLLQYTGELTLSRNLLGCLRLKNIVNANATELDWEDVCPKDDDEIYIIGNPPYKGARKQTDSQKADMTLNRMRKL